MKAKLKKNKTVPELEVWYCDFDWLNFIFSVRGIKNKDYLYYLSFLNIYKTDWVDPKGYPYQIFSHKITDRDYKIDYKNDLKDDGSYDYFLRNLKIEFLKKYIKDNKL